MLSFKTLALFIRIGKMVIYVLSYWIANLNEESRFSYCSSKQAIYILDLS